MEVLRPNENNLQRLGEILSSYIGTKVSSSLSMLLGESVTHKVRRIMELDSANLESLIPVFDIIPMCSVYMKGEGDIHLALLFSLPSSMAKQFAAKLLGIKKIVKLSSLEKSSLSEAGNMLAGSFFNALSDGTGFKIDLSVPGFAIDTFKTLLEPPTLEISKLSDSVIVADAELHSLESNLKVHILILLSPSEAKKLLEASVT